MSVHNPLSDHRIKPRAVQMAYYSYDARAKHTKTHTDTHEKWKLDPFIPKKTNKRHSSKTTTPFTVLLLLPTTPPTNGKKDDKKRVVVVVVVVK
jgi:hypothetical protein